MCGRFAQVLTHDHLVKLQKELNATISSEQLEISYNVAPTQQVMAIVSKDGIRYNGFFRWGLIPSWMKSMPKTPLINVRSETIHEKPSFKASFIRRRAIVPANGFFEWQAPGKIPHYIYPADGGLLYMGAIYDLWESDDGSYVPSLGIITTEANELMLPLHHRMPLILPPDAYDPWLNDSFQDLNALRGLLLSFSEPKLQYHRVSTAVNKVANNFADIVKEYGTQEDIFI
ncbi:MAG TPA: DUF159 family protein [Candidatus Cloacimonas sp.]|jgi:putative SOS response-associated peptidase YedK|nr:DUF159 family protein [Candidatus Cloacimonas sp.]